MGISLCMNSTRWIFAAEILQFWKIMDMKHGWIFDLTDRCIARRWGKTKDEEPYEVSTIAGVRLPSQCMALTGYALFYDTRFALRSQKGNEGVYIPVFNNKGAKTI